MSRLFSRILALLAQPHPAHAHLGEYFRFICLITGGVFFVLASFLPFGLSQLSGWRQIGLPLAYSLLAFTSMAVGGIWIAVFPQIFRESTWTLGRELLWATYQFFSIGIFLQVVAPLLFGPSHFFPHFGAAFFAAMLVGLLPYLGGTGLRHYSLLKQHYREALLLNQQLQVAKHRTRAIKTPVSPSLVINGTGLDGPPNELLFVESNGNYLYFHAADREGRPTQTKIRATLKEALEALDAWPRLVRCHRAYLVNLDKVQQVEGNAAGLRLLLHESLPWVPVSRAYTATVRAYFQRSGL
jgi:hypothetical protein